MGQNDLKGRSPNVSPQEILRVLALFILGVALAVYAADRFHRYDEVKPAVFDAAVVPAPSASSRAF